MNKQKILHQEKLPNNLTLVAIRDRRFDLNNNEIDVIITDNVYHKDNGTIICYDFKEFCANFNTKRRKLKEKFTADEMLTKDGFLIKKQIRFKGFSHLFYFDTIIAGPIELVTTNSISILPDESMWEESWIVEDRDNFIKHILRNEQ